MLEIVLLIRILVYGDYPLDLTKVEHFLTLKESVELSMLFCLSITYIPFSQCSACGVQDDSHVHVSFSDSN